MAVALLLVDGLPTRQPPFVQFSQITAWATERGIPIHRFAIPRGLSPLKLLQQGTFTNQVLPRFQSAYQEVLSDIGDDTKLIIGGYSLGGSIIYAWATSPSWQEQERLCVAFTLSSPYRIEEGFVIFELNASENFNQQVPIAEEPVPAPLLANRLRGKLEILYGDSDRTIKEHNAKIEDNIATTNRINQHKLEGARHLSIGSHPGIMTRLQPRLEACITTTDFIEQAPASAAASPPTRPMSGSS